MEEHRLQQKFFSQLLEQYAVKSDECLHSIVVGDESWFLHFDLETK
jgi:hypothetical protein